MKKLLSSSRGNTGIYLIIVIIAFAALLTSGAMVNKSAVDKTEEFDNPVERTGGGQQNLQLKDLTFSKKSPPPQSKTCDGSSKGYGTLITKDQNKGVCCYYHVYTDSCTVCCSGVCVDKNDPRRIAINPNISPPAGADFWCDAKPVIYLYPTKPTFVDVTLVVPGSIIESIPTYSKDGWKNVLAYPDGKLIYQNKTYNELFYEASITPIKPPTDGIIVPTKDLETKLTDITTKLGLIPSEQKEFIEYWAPRLQSLNSKYILVSVFTPSQKEIIDKVNITPKPDTFIQFIMYYKPLNEKVNIKPLEFNPIPKRIGFTAVEWGGVIDNK